VVGWSLEWGGVWSGVEFGVGWSLECGGVWSVVEVGVWWRLECGGVWSVEEVAESVPLNMITTQRLFVSDLHLLLQEQQHSHLDLQVCLQRPGVDLCFVN
jgi:hypothetical protein